MQFVALDLETTGLDPHQDTIIEVAAVRFDIELDADTFVMKYPEERSMLIYPKRILEQEVTMITGITNDMLIGKPDFESVRDKIRDFIGDAVIVGHNVLFDIAMFETHGINLSTSIVIDTFELSELFSQDIESLNLGFLTNHYHLIDPNEAEHRALTDTKLSIRLLMRYLGEIRKLDGKKKQIWNTLVSRDTSHTLTALSKICHLSADPETNTKDLFIDLLSPRDETSTPSKISKTTQESTVRSLYDIHGNPDEELQLIKNIFKSNTHILIITPGYKTTLWMSQFLTEHIIENMVSISTNKWCSVEYMQEILNGQLSFSRKEIILILKIAFWMNETTTGLIDELKFYGEERAMIDIFRCRETEWTIWRKQYEDKVADIPILISDIHSGNITDTNRYKIIKDIPLLEDSIRRRESREISFDTLLNAIECLTGDIISIETRIHISNMASIIRSIYEAIPDRPTGPLISPPGAYGETYFITQKMLWHNGHKWLIHATQALNTLWKKWKETNTEEFSRKLKIHIEYIDYAVGILVQYHTFADQNLNITLNINHEKTKITLIPRSVKKLLEPILKGSNAFGSQISLPQTKTFLMKEYGYTEEEFSKLEIGTAPKTKIIYSEYHPNIIQAGSVVLTTSQKHARDIGKALRKIYGKNTEVLIQGLSGGKGKMLSIFNEKNRQVILVGIIDTWRDEYMLWNNAQAIIIAKLPFDPPTDPYFLARTVGMSNNFSEYSEPIVTIRLNTLIERINEATYVGNIIVTDSRLISTEWGKRILGELL